MDKLYFKPVTNIIGGSYFVCPESENRWERVIFKTDKLGAFLLSLLQEDITCDEMTRIAQDQFPDKTHQDILNKAIRIKNTLRGITLKENILEVVEI